MKSQIKLATVFGVELGLHYSWLIIALLIVFSLGSQFQATNPEWGTAVIWTTAIFTGILFFAGLFAHELSHALVAKARGIPIHKITLFMLGGMAQIEGEPSRPSTEFWMAIMGPITSGAIGLVLLALAYALGWRMGAVPATPGVALLEWLGYINLALGAFNMIPGFPLDGGRVLRAIIWAINKNARRSTEIAARVGQVVAVLFIGYGLVEAFSGAAVGGIWIAFIGWFLLQAAGASLMQARMTELLSGVRARDLMTTDCLSIPPGLTLELFAQEMVRSGRRCFLVLEDDRLAGLITPQELKGIPPERWGEMRVRDAMRPASKIHFIGPDTPAREVLEIMAREDVNQLPVITDGHLIGVVGRGQILQSLQMRQQLSGGNPRAA